MQCLPSFAAAAINKKRHGGIRRWLVRNSLSLALIGIILLSMTVGAIGCLAFLPKPQDTSTPKTKTDVSTATVMQPDITSPSLEPVPEPQVFYFDIPLSEELQDYIREKCSEYEVPMELVIALIDKESSFRSDVVSTTNDYGFMQINQCNHEWLSSTLGVSNFLDPKENILCGIYITRKKKSIRSFYTQIRSLVLLHFLRVRFRPSQTALRSTGGKNERGVYSKTTRRTLRLSV